jgi:hypothetical protein
MAMKNIISLDKNRPCKMSEVVCLKCLRRWIAVRPVETSLKILECKCGEIGYVIETGEDIEKWQE